MRVFWATGMDQLPHAHGRGPTKPYSTLNRAAASAAGTPASPMETEDFLIVGLGASAGGIKAFREFFQHVPQNSGAAYVVILHLSPEHESRLAEVLQVVTAMPVRQVHDRVHVQPDHVYVIPPSQSLGMVDGYLALSPLQRLEERRAPVDIFFRTLAEAHG